MFCDFRDMTYSREQRTFIVLTHMCTKSRALVCELTENEFEGVPVHFFVKVGIDM